MFRSSSTTLGAAITVALGAAAIILPALFGTAAVMLLAGVMLASGVVGLLNVNAARRAGFAASVAGPWVHIIAGAVIFLWPELALWLVAVVLGGGLILGGITGLSALKASQTVNPTWWERVEPWAGIVLGVILIVMGAAGSAMLLGFVLGIALIASGLRQWRLGRARA